MSARFTCYLTRTSRPASSGHRRRTGGDGASARSGSTRRGRGRLSRGSRRQAPPLPAQPLAQVAHTSHGFSSHNLQSKAPARIRCKRKTLLQMCCHRLQRANSSMVCVFLSATRTDSYLSMSNANNGTNVLRDNYMWTLHRTALHF